MNFSLLSVALLSSFFGYSRSPWSTHEPLNLILMLAFSEDEAARTGLGLGPTAAIAIEEARAQHLNGRPVNWTVIGTRCSPKHSVHELIILLRDKSTVYHGIIGPQCDDVCSAVGFIAATYDIVEIAYGCQDSGFNEPSLYPTMIRTGSSLDLILPPLVADLIETLNIEDLVVIWPEGSSMESKIAYAVEATARHAVDGNFNVSTSYFLRDQHLDTEEMMQSIKAMLLKLKPVYKSESPHPIPLIFSLYSTQTECGELGLDLLFL